MKLLRTDKRGYTLMELMIAISIMVVLMSVATFNYVKMAPKRRLEGAAFDVMATLRRARMLAVSGNTRSRITLGTNKITVWTDTDRDGAVDTGESFDKAIDSKITVYRYPDTGTFTSRGAFESSALYLYISLYHTGIGYKYLYVFPSGQVDLYNP